MCDFVSWIDNSHGQIWFMTDAECKKLIRYNPTKGWNDVIGHSAIKQAKPEAYGSQRESIDNIPPVIARAIKDGKMNMMMKYGGKLKALSYDAKGRLHSLTTAAYKTLSGTEVYYIHGRYFGTKAEWLKAKAALRRKAARAKAKVAVKAKK